MQPEHATRYTLKVRVCTFTAREDFQGGDHDECCIHEAELELDSLCKVGLELHKVDAIFEKFSQGLPVSSWKVNKDYFGDVVGLVRVAAVRSHHEGLAHGEIVEYTTSHGLDAHVQIDRDDTYPLTEAQLAEFAVGMNQS